MDQDQVAKLDWESAVCDIRTAGRREEAHLLELLLETPVLLGPEVTGTVALAVWSRLKENHCHRIIFYTGGDISPVKGGAGEGS